MKKPILLLVLLCIVGAGVFLFKDRLGLGLNNDPEIEKLVTISQSDVSAFVFATQESESDHRLHMYLTPFVNIDIDEKQIQSFSIGNFKGTCSAGEVLLIHPTDLGIDTMSRTFLFTESTEPIKLADLISDGNSIAYNVVSGVSAFNEVKNVGSITPYFGIVVKDIGSVNYKEILERDGVFDGGKYLEYGGISVDTLTTDIQFDIGIVFTDNSKYTKRLKGVLDGTMFNTQPTVTFTLEKVE